MRRTVNLNAIPMVQKFVNDMSKFPCDVDIIRNKYLVDAKSIMGIMSLDLSKPVDVELISEDPELIARFETIIKEYE